MSPSMMKKKDKDFSVVVSKKESPMSAKKKVLSWTQHLNQKIIETLVCKILNTKKIFEIDDAILPSQCAPYSR
jgi:hypothetical protein